LHYSLQARGSFRLSFNSRHGSIGNTSAHSVIRKVIRR